MYDLKPMSQQAFKDLMAGVKAGVFDGSIVFNGSLIVCTPSGKIVEIHTIGKTIHELVLDELDA